MRSLLVSLFAILMIIFALAACGTSGSITLGTPPLEASASPAASPAPSKTQTATTSPSPAVDPEIEDVITAFVSAQNVHDWNAFVNLWAGLERKFLQDFFTWPDNKEKQNGYFAIKSAELTNISEITNLDEYYDLDISYELDNYSEVRVFSVQVNYNLSKEFWSYKEDTNELILVLVSEDGTWKISQDYQNIEAEDNTDYDAHKNHRDGTIHSTNMFTCYFLRLDWGDYMHMEVRTIEGEEIWFWMTHTEVDPETLAKYQKMKITWVNRDSYIEEAEQVINEDAITDIKLLD